MTTKQHDGILFFLFAVSVAALVYGQDFFMNRMLERKAESRALRTESMTLETETKEQVRQIEVFKKAITVLEGYQLGIPENEVDFYAWVQQELAKNGIKSNSVKPAKGGQGRSAVQVDFEGPYYSFVRTLADWRNLKVAIRLVSMNLTSINGETGKGSAIIESVLKR